MKKLEKIVLVKEKKFLFKVETSDAADDYNKYEELRNEIWAFAEDSLPGSRNMLCENFLHDGSSLFIAVYVEDKKGGFIKDKSHLIGFSYGFVGVRDKNLAFRSLDNLQFYSQYTGVLPDFHAYGLGIFIKEFQKEKLLELFGISTVTCTYDPLTGVNAYRNVHHFGMEVLEYREDVYGGFGGLLNRIDIPTDRFYMSWDLKRKVRRPAPGLKTLLRRSHRVMETDLIKVAGKSGPLELEVMRKIDLGLDSEFVLVQIPLNFYHMLRETDVRNKRVRQIPLDWRLETRKVFQSLFSAGYKVIDFQKAEAGTKGNFYLLKK